MEKLHKETLQNLEWIKQRDDFNCGPALLINFLRIINTENIPQTIGEIRDQINTLRKEKNRPELQREDQFTNKDLILYLRDKIGLRVKEFTAFPYNKEEVLDNLKNYVTNNKWDIIYATFGKHFRGIHQLDNENFILLDSFLDGPQNIDQAKFESFLKHAVNANERPEVVGVVSRNISPDLHGDIL